MDETSPYFKKYYLRIRKSDEIQSLTEQGKYTAPELPVKVKLEKDNIIAPLGLIPRKAIFDFIFGTTERLIKLYEEK